jgi:hypothetical protein
MLPVPAPADDLDQIEALLAELVPRIDDAPPARRGRPIVLHAGLVWASVLLAVLHGGASLRGVGRTAATTGALHYPGVPVTDEGFRSRLIALGWAPLARLFSLVTSTLAARFPGDTSLAPAFPGGVYAMDSSTLDKVAKPLRDGNGPHAELAGRLHTLFDIRRQLFTEVIAVDLPTQSEQVAAPDLLACLPPASLVLFDRGYTNYRRYDELTTAGQAFITRLRANASYLTRWVLTDTAVVRDEEIWLGKYRADRCGHPARLITIRVGSQTRSYLTNVLSPAVLPPIEVYRLYRRRWDIERGFKTLKRDLGLAWIWASRWDLILVQIWATLVIVQIVAALRQEVARRAGEPLEHVSLELLIEVLPKLAAHARATGQDVLDLLVARGRAIGLIRPVRRVSLDVPPDLPWEPPPDDLPTWRTPRYAGKG